MIEPHRQTVIFNDALYVRCTKCDVLYLDKKGKFCMIISVGLERVPEEGELAGTLFRGSEIENSQGKIFSLYKIPFLHFFSIIL